MWYREARQGCSSWDGCDVLCVAIVELEALLAPAQGRAFSAPSVGQNCGRLGERFGEMLLQLSSVHALLANVPMSDCWGAGRTPNVNFPLCDSKAAVQLLYLLWLNLK